MISPSQRPLPDNTQHSQHTNIQALSGIRTRDRSRRAAVDLRLRPRGHWDRHFCILGNKFSVNSIEFSVFKGLYIVIHHFARPQSLMYWDKHQWTRLGFEPPQEDVIWCLVSVRGMLMQTEMWDTSNPTQQGSCCCPGKCFQLPSL